MCSVPANVILEKSQVLSRQEPSFQGHRDARNIEAPNRVKMAFLKRTKASAFLQEAFLFLVDPLEGSTFQRMASPAGFEPASPP